LTGAFDGTAIVILKNEFRFGIQEQESLFIFYKAIQVKYQVLNLNLEDIFAVLHQLIKHAGFGMLVQENACQYFEAIMTKF